MKTVILGAGNRGFALAKHLIDEGKDVVLIDLNPERIKFISSKLDCMTVCGSGTDIEVLGTAGLDASDTFVAVTESDEVNIVACGLVNSVFRARRTVATIRNLSYSGKNGIEGKSMLGISYIVNPEEEAAKRIANMIVHGVYSDVITFQNSPLTLHNVVIEKGNPLAGQKLMDIRKQLKFEFVAAAINRHGKAYIPSGDSLIKEGDIISLVADSRKVNSILESFGKQTKKAKKIVIAGGTTIAQYLLKNFEPSILKNIVLIEKDGTLSDKFAKTFHDILVLKGDLRQENIFEDENLTGYDLMISLEENDEFNVLLACIAKRMGFRHTVALTKTNNNYMMITPKLDIDAIISVTEATVASLLKFTRDDNISSMQSLFGGQVEIIEFVISESSKTAGKRLMDLNMKNRAIIAGISKADGTEVIPGGNYTIEPGDTIVTAVGIGNVGFITSLMS